MSLLEQAIALAVAAHAGQVCRNGCPYILHPLHLMMQMETETEMMTAVLHDVVEDTAVTFDDLVALGLPEEVLTAVGLLTHDNDTSYRAYIATLKPNPLARRVKVADLEHNMDIRRLPYVRKKDLKRLRKYHCAWQMLCD
ncbi:MAG: GTP pyrophosphokinase [Chloroflexi bacterium]|nr:GTP pyrophosphokinase [Chloroflexota bacterium]